MMENKDIKLKKRKLFVYISLAVVILLIITFSITYAYFKINISYDKTPINIISTVECVDLNIAEGTTDIALTYNYPISDELALNGGATPVTVTITNNCSSEIKYSLVLSTLTKETEQSNYIDDSKIRYKIIKNGDDFKGIDYLNNINKISKNSNLYGYLTGTNGELSLRYPDYTLKEVYSIDDVVSVLSNKSNTYQIYMWVDYYEGDKEMYLNENAKHDEIYDGSTENKKFAAAINLSFNDGTSNEE